MPSGQTLAYIWQNNQIKAVTANSQPLITNIVYEATAKSAAGPSATAKPVSASMTLPAVPLSSTLHLMHLLRAEYPGADRFCCNGCKFMEQPLKKSSNAGKQYCLSISLAWSKLS